MSTSTSPVATSDLIAPKDMAFFKAHVTDDHHFRAPVGVGGQRFEAVQVTPFAFWAASVVYKLFSFKTMSSYHFTYGI